MCSCGIPDLSSELFLGPLIFFLKVELVFLNRSQPLRSTSFQNKHKLIILGFDATKYLWLPKCR